MEAANFSLDDSFRQELAALRAESLLFSEKHPELARTLGLNAREASDPQVELLLQSFAFLGARLRHQVEQDKANLPNALLSLLYPHLEAPVPAMLIAQIDVKPDGTDFTKEQSLARGRTSFAAAAEYPFLAATAGAQSVLRVRLCADGIGALQNKGKGPQRLRFFINDAHAGALALYELLA